MRRIVVAALTILLLAGVVTSAHAATPPDGQAESDFLSRTNADRAASGLAPLRLASDLVDLARRHSEDMAASDSIFHTPNLGGTVQNWQKVGENVGRGSAVDVVENAFMASPTHRENILDGAYSETGIGVVWKDATLYVTVLFRQPKSSTAAAAAPAPSKPAPAPATVHAASVAPRPAAPRPAAPVAAPTPPAPPAAPAIPAFSPEAIAASMARSSWDVAALTTERPPTSGRPARPAPAGAPHLYALFARLVAVALVGALAALVYQRRPQLTFGSA